MALQLESEECQEKNGACGLVFSWRASGKEQGCELGERSRGFPFFNPAGLS